MNQSEFRERYQYDSEKDLLGQGGFGRVFRARDLLLDRRVALKVFSRDVPERYDLISEIRRAIDLNHPNICRYYGAEVLRGVDALGEPQTIQVGVMEFVEGGTIGEFLTKSPEFRIKLLADVLRGLSYLHQHRPPIIHRDLKPPNVLVGFEDGVPVAKIADFGISKPASGSGANISFLGLGTYAYMAPEQLNPDRYGVHGKIQCNLDLWSFGVMTIELLTGVLPFGGDAGASTGQIMEAIVRGISPQVLNGFEEPYRGVLTRCMVQDAAMRAQNAAELLGLLEAPKQASAEQRRQTVVEDVWTRPETVFEESRERAKPAPKPHPKPRPQPVVPSPAPVPEETEEKSTQGIYGFLDRNWFRTVTIFLVTIHAVVAILGLVAEISFAVWMFFLGSLIGTVTCILLWKKYGSWREWVESVRNGYTWIFLFLSFCLILVPYFSAAEYIEASWGGNLKECKTLGDDYLSGNMYLKDPSRGADLLERACSGNNGSACDSLGDIYRYGNGFSQDYAAAETYYAKACRGGDSTGCNNLDKLGAAYRDGDRVYKNGEKAVDLFQKACDGGDPNGCFDLGYAYAEGRGVKRNYAAAVAPYQHACDRHISAGCNNLGLLYENGQGVGQDNARAAALYQKACDASIAGGCSNLGDLYWRGAGVPQNRKKGKELLQKGCGLGNEWGCSRLKNLQ